MTRVGLVGRLEAMGQNSTSSIQIFGRRKCRVTRKAERFFRDRGIPYQFVDLDLKAMSAGELRSVLQSIPASELIDAESPSYRKRGMAWMEFDAEEEIAEDPGLMRTPVVRRGSLAAAGDDPAAWKRLSESG